MSKTLRIALIWMLMLAVPAQGMAAIAMQMGSLDNRGAASARATGHHHPGAFAAGMHTQEAPAQLAHPAAGDPAAGDPAPGGQGASGNGPCSQCAFCVGAVNLTSVVVNQSLPQVRELSLLRLDRFVGFVADTPLRPPRQLLA